MNSKCNQLWQELIALLDYKARKDSYYSDLNTELSRLKKMLTKEPEEYKRVLILEEVIDFVARKIEHDASAKEVINSFATHAYDESKKLKKNKNIFSEVTINKIDEFYEALEECSREKLYEYEAYYNEKLKEKSKVFGQAKARGQIVGALNKGMYGFTKEEIINTINANGGSLKNNDRLIDYMRLDLIKYRIIALRMAGKYCDKSLENQIEKTGSNVLEDSCYEKMLKRTKELGNIIKEIYEEENYVTPIEEIKINVPGPDTKALEVFTKEKEPKKSINKK